MEASLRKELDIKAADILKLQYVMLLGHLCCELCELNTEMTLMQLHLQWRKSSSSSRSSEKKRVQSP